MARRKRRETNKGAIWMGVFVIVIMVASTLAFVFNDQQSGSGGLKYNGYNIKVNSQNNRYILDVDGTIHNFYYHPTELEYYDFDSSIVPLIQGGQIVVVSFDPTLEQDLLAYQDLFRLELSQVISKQTFGSITTESENYDLPVITCANATIQQPIIVLNNSLEPGIIKETSCITVNARGLELLRMKDLLAYHILGVME